LQNSVNLIHYLRTAVAGFGEGTSEERTGTKGRGGIGKRGRKGKGKKRKVGKGSEEKVKGKR